MSSPTWARGLAGCLSQRLPQPGSRRIQRATAWAGKSVGSGLDTGVGNWDAGESGPILLAERIPTLNDKSESRGSALGPARPRSALGIISGVGSEAIMMRYRGRRSPGAARADRTTASARPTPGPAARRPDSVRRRPSSGYSDGHTGTRARDRAGIGPPP
jgi:hypothetical protein